MKFRISKTFRGFWEKCWSFDIDISRDAEGKLNGTMGIGLGWPILILCVLGYTFGLGLKLLGVF